MKCLLIRKNNLNNLKKSNSNLKRIYKKIKISNKLFRKIRLKVIYHIIWIKIIFVYLNNIDEVKMP